MSKDSGNDTKHVLNSKTLWEWLLMSPRLSFSTSFPGPAAIQSQQWRHCKNIHGSFFNTFVPDSNQVFAHWNLTIYAIIF